MKSQVLSEALTIPSAPSPNSSTASPADKRLEALRGAVDIRLAALETALADPAKGESLEYLILDLARVATEEAQASAARACIDIRLETELQIAHAQAAVKSTLDAERAARSDSDRALEMARQRIAVLERDVAAARQAAQRAADDARAQANATNTELERSVGRLERSLHETRDKLQTAEASLKEQRREFERAEERVKAAAEDLGQSMASRRQLEQALAAEREVIAISERALVEARSQLETERRAVESLRDADAASCQQLEASTRRETAALAQIAKVESELVLERQLVADLGRGHSDLQATLESHRVQAAGLRQDLKNATERIAALEKQEIDARTASTLRDAEASADFELRLTGIKAEFERRETETRSTFERREAEAKYAFERREAEIQAAFEVRVEQVRTEHAGQQGSDRAARERLDQELAAQRAVVADLQERMGLLQTDLEAERMTVAGLRDAATQLEHRMKLEIEAERNGARQLQEIALAAEARAAALIQQVDEAVRAREQLAAELHAERLLTANLQQARETLAGDLEAERTATGDLRRQAAFQSARIDELTDASRVAVRQAQEAEARAEAQLALAGQGTQETLAAHSRLAVELDQQRAVAEELRRECADSLVALDIERQSAALLRARIEEAGREAAATLEARLKDATEAADAALRTHVTELERKIAALEQERAQSAAGKNDAQEALGNARAEVQWLRDDLERARGRIEALAAGRADHERAWRETEAQLRLMTQDRDEVAAKLEAATAAAAAQSAVAEAPAALVPSATPLRVLPSPAYRPGQAKAAGRTPSATQSKLLNARAKGPENEWVAVRLAARYKFTPPIDIDVSGKAAKLFDLSAGGCQILSTVPLRPKQPIKVTLRADPAALVCMGTVVWANLEPAGPNRPGGYRAGVQFKGADETALEAFIVSHGATA